jgi:hypothetical protein
MVINPTYITVPDFGASADIVEPDSPAPYVDGYLPNQQWPAQHANFFLNGLTTNLNDAVETISATVVEINNVLSAAGITPSDSITNQLLQSIQQSSGGLLWRQDCRVATTANITLSGAQTIDSISVVAGDRVLVKNQSTAADNGVYVCAAGAWSRATDLDTSAEMLNGVAVRILVGTTNASTAWVLVTGGTITLGSTSLSFIRAPLPGINIVAPTALTYTSAALTRNTLFVINNLTGTFDITAGATAIGIMARIVVTGLSTISAGVTLVTTTSTTNASLLNGTYTFIWDGSAWVAVGRMNVNYFITATGAGTFVAPWTGPFIFDAISAGGSGGGSQSTATDSIAIASGGGGGAQAIFQLNLTAGSTVHYNIGAGGTAPSAGANNGNAGGNTIIGSTLAGTEYVSITGGAAGLGANAGNSTVTRAAMVLGGAVTFGASTPTSGKLLSKAGASSEILYNSNLSTVTQNVIQSNGGNSPVGATPSALILTSGNSSAGQSALTSPGAGGGGAGSNVQNTARAGAAGTDGRINIAA